MCVSSALDWKHLVHPERTSPRPLPYGGTSAPPPLIVHHDAMSRDFIGPGVLFDVTVWRGQLYADTSKRLAAAREPGCSGNIGLSRTVPERAIAPEVLRIC